MLGERGADRQGRCEEEPLGHLGVGLAWGIGGGRERFAECHGSVGLTFLWVQLLADLSVRREAPGREYSSHRSSAQCKIA